VQFIDCIEVVVRITEDVKSTKEAAAKSKKEREKEAAREAAKEKEKGKGKEDTGEGPTVGIGGKYGLIDAIIDGVFVSIGSINLKVVAPEFEGTVSLTGLQLHSPTPNWEVRSAKAVSP